MPTGLCGRNPGRSRGAILFYEAFWRVFRIIWGALWRFEALGMERVPAAGGLLIVANHQSHLDPVSLGMAVRRRHVTFIARSGLLKVPGFGAIIGLLNAVPLRQDAPDVQAIRTAVSLLGAGRAVLIFPEGSRTPDGAMHPFRRGAWLVLSRARCRVLPMAVEGTYDTMPRGKLPRVFGRKIMAKVGVPIEADELLKLGHEAGLERLAEVIEQMRGELAVELARQGYRVTTSGRSSAELSSDGLVTKAAAEHAPHGQRPDVQGSSE